MTEKVVLQIPVDKETKERAERHCQSMGKTLEEAIGEFIRERGEEKDTVWVLETNVDDCSGEQLGYTMECLLEAGALDTSCFPVYMKKNRPAYMLQVICRVEMREELESILFRETTSIGLRRYREEREILPRTFAEVCLKTGQKIRVKICEHHGEKFYYPEYETVKTACRESRRAFRDVYDEAAALAGGNE